MLLLDQKASMLVKVSAIILAIWLLNVVFVAIHEIGHASLATYFGAKVCNLYVSPAGYNGATTYTMLSTAYESNLVMAGGLLATTIATLIVYMLKIELAVYVIGLRTVESLTNFARDSDMASLAGWIGWQSWAFSLLAAGVITFCMAHMLYDKRLKTFEPGRRVKTASKSRAATRGLK